MELHLQRDSSSNEGTTGILDADGIFVAYTLELYLGDGGVGCAIPTGRYPVIMAWSPHFQERLAHVQNVPGRSDILIHDGNTDQDTEGCILVGLERLSPGEIAQSDLARLSLQKKIGTAIAQQEPVWLTVTNPPVAT